MNFLKKINAADIYCEKNILTLYYVRERGSRDDVRKLLKILLPAINRWMGAERLESIAYMGVKHDLMEDMLNFIEKIDRGDTYKFRDLVIKNIFILDNSRFLNQLIKIKPHWISRIDAMDLILQAFSCGSMNSMKVLKDSLELTNDEIYECIGKYVIEDAISEQNLQEFKDSLPHVEISDLIIKYIIDDKVNYLQFILENDDDGRFLEICSRNLKQSKSKFIDYLLDTKRVPAQQIMVLLIEDNRINEIRRIFAKGYRMPPSYLYAKSMQMMELLIEYGGDPKLADISYHMEFKQYEMCEIIKYLLANGADPNKYSDGRRPPLISAICRTNERLFDLLISYGADVNITITEANKLITPLKCALDYGEERMAETLLCLHAEYKKEYFGNDIMDKWRNNRELRHLRVKAGLQALRLQDLEILPGGEEYERARKNFYNASWEVVDSRHTHRRAPNAQKEADSGSRT